MIIDGAPLDEGVVSGETPLMLACDDGNGPAPPKRAQYE